MELTDICCNLTHESFDSDRAQVLARARAAGVTRFLLAGADLPESRACIALAERHAGCRAAVGVHPHQARSWTAGSAGELRALAGAPAVCAIGECGLDYHRDLSPRPTQRAAFAAQLELAWELGLPALLHCRDADGDFLAALDAAGARRPRAVLHCFTGGAELLAACLERGLHIGLTGWFCDERRGAHLAGLAAAIPPGRLLLETDAPYLLPRTLRPRPATRRNEPMWLPHIAARVAAARGQTLEELARQTSACARELFGFAPGAGAQRL